jgi:Fur family ferric uptake transcriptional regulator
MLKSFFTKDMTMNNADLKKVGLKITLPRIKILEILENTSDRHLSAEDIYKILIESGEDIGLATVYRVLTQFVEAKLVVRHHFAEGYSVFELDSGIHHDHLVCVECGHVEEFFDPVIEKRQKEVAGRAGFSITDHSLTIYGICNKHS